MELALYQPGLGYYETDRARVGFQGDFYTSVSTGELFGQLLAFRFAGWLGELPAAADPLRIVEAGAHDGRLARDILGWLARHRPELWRRVRYCIIEPSGRRREWQREMLKEFAGKVEWAEGLGAINFNAGNLAGTPGTPHPGPLPEERGNGSPSLVNPLTGTVGKVVEHSAALCRDAATAVRGGTLNGIIFSNELLDAMPVHRLGWDAARREWFEWGVTAEGEGFGWARMPPAAGGFYMGFQFPEGLLAVLPDGYAIEVCPAAAQWWREAASLLARGRLLTLDYGFTTEEMISPSRTKGTVRGYYRQHLSDDLLANVGGQDLTAHVNFSVVQAAGESAGLTTEGYLTQPQFLTRILAEAIKDAAFKDWNASRTRQFQTLTHPEHLGRAFKVLVQGSGGR